MRLIDVRCDGTRKTGPQRGLVCRYLLCRVSPDVFGLVETKCPRCNKVRAWTFTGALVAVST